MLIGMGGQMAYDTCVLPYISCTIPLPAVNRDPNNLVRWYSPVVQYCQCQKTVPKLISEMWSQFIETIKE